MSSAPPFDRADLERYLRDHNLCEGPITLHRVGHGHSNLTYLVDDGHHRVVVRRPPPPPIPPGGHDVLREAGIQRALADSGVPVPTILATEAAGTVMDSPFYVMSYVNGVVATTDTPHVIDNPADRRRLAETMLDTLAHLHTVDYRAAGLEDFGRPSTDMKRHLRRFSRVLDPEGHGLDGELGDLLEELIDNAPVQQSTTIVHGDFRLGNLMLATDAPPKILAVLDWELATIGDPLRDLGYFLATYAVPGESPHALTAMSSASLADGYPGRHELAQRYATRSGRELTQIDWYLRMALWKVAVLFEYQTRRVAQGIGDPYYAQPGLVKDLITATRHITAGP
jgi:aminoglycoside phosphotransferase (APT) family kinase protein